MGMNMSLLRGGKLIVAFRIEVSELSSLAVLSGLSWSDNIIFFGV